MSNSMRAATFPIASALPSASARYCALAALGAVVLLSLAAAVNIAVDPYLVFDSPRVVGLNALKPMTPQYADLAKDALLARATPQTLALGTSKVDVGIDPDSPFWPSDARPVFNDGRPGIGIAAMALGLQHAVASAAPPRRVFLMLELPEFMEPAASGPRLPAPEANAWTRELEHVRQVASAALSLDTLADSLTTVLSQSRAHVVDLSADGSTSDALFEAPIAADGASVLFAQKIAQYRRGTLALAEALARHPPTEPAQLPTLRAIIALCREHHIALDIAIAPFHAEYLELMSKAGLWERYEQAKTAITRTVAEAGAGQVKLWDFIGYDRFSTEQVPDGRGARPANWFWEPVHFRKALGEKILATVYADATEYGAKLTPATLPARLAAERAARDAYERPDAPRLARGETTRPPA